MKLTGRCYCGDVHYEIEGDAQASLHCHCRECQYVSGGNPAALMIFPLEAFRLTQGEMKQFRPFRSGAPGHPTFLRALRHWPCFRDA